MDGFPEVWPIEKHTFYNQLLDLEPSRRSAPSDPREHKLCASWIVRACMDYGFRPDTAALAVEYFAAFLKGARQANPASLTFKQLIVKVAGKAVTPGVHKESQICELLCICCIAISAKKLEAKEKAPYLGDFDENFSFQELRAMESLVLIGLDFNLTYATAFDFSEFWLSRTSPSVDRKGLKTLIHEAINTCIKEEAFFTMPAHLFGTAANLWAHYAMKIPLEEFEAEVIATTKSEGGLNEDLLEGLATIGSVMQEAYPHAYKPVRASSPDNLLEVHTVFSGEVRKGSLKRPTPERFNAKPADTKVAKLVK